MRFSDLEGIKNIPKDRVVTYARIVVDYRPQKADPTRVRICNRWGEPHPIPRRINNKNS